MFSSQYCFYARQFNIESLLLEVVQTSSVTLFTMFKVSQCLCKFSLERPLWFWQPSFISTTIFGPINFIKGTAISSVSVLNTVMRPPWPVTTTNVISADKYCFCFIIFSLIQLHFIYSLEYSVSYAMSFSNLFCYLYVKVNCNALFYFIQQNIKLKMF